MKAIHSANQRFGRVIGQRFSRGARLCAVVALLGSSVATMSTAQAQDGVVIDVSGAKRGAYPLAIPVAVDSDAGAASEVATVASFDMAVAGFFKVLDPKSFLADLNAEKLSIDAQKWKDVGAFGVMKYRVVATGAGIEFEAKLFEVSKGATAVLSQTYRGSRGDLRKFAHMWCNAMVKHYTNEPGFFGSKLAFVNRGKKTSAVYAMDFDGHGAYLVSKNSSTNMLPAWSPSGGIAYTSFMRNNPDLYVSTGGGRAKKIASYKGMNTGAAYSPDGSLIALTLSKDGNPEIYIIKASDGTVLRRLTSNKAIDTSPAWSPDGSRIAFVSDREGGPQIFVVAAAGGEAKRISFNGSYNTTPAWSPKKGANIIAYTTRDGSSYDIVTLDLESKKMVRVTQNEGNNEEPSFSPNGRAIAFARSGGGGSGVYIANSDGTGKAVKVHAGAVTGVDWGPAPRE
jgi:TolB protein